MSKLKTTTWLSRSVGTQSPMAGGKPTRRAALPRALFLSEIYPPSVGGTCNKFSSRFARFPGDCATVVTKTVDGAEQFDCGVDYTLKRISISWRGPRGFEWMGVVWDLLKGALPCLRAGEVRLIECARPIPEGVAGYLLARLFRKKLVVNAQGEDISVLQNYRVERFVMKRILRAADLNIANSACTESLIKRLAGPRAKTGVVHPGLRADALGWSCSSGAADALRASFGGQPVLLTLARLQARKGQDNVVRALPIVARQFPHVRYVVAGSSHGGTAGLLESLRDLARGLGVAKHVVLVGEVSANEVPLYYSACDLFVMPNRQEPGGDLEGFGQVFLEAGLFEKPVIGGNSGGVPDAVKHKETGLLVDGTSVEQIAKAIIEILSNPELARTMGRRGKEMALSMTADAVFGRYACLLKRAGLC